jgi:hypothetical protein
LRRSGALPICERRPPVPAFFAFVRIESVDPQNDVAVLQRRTFSVVRKTALTPR